MVKTRKIELQPELFSIDNQPELFDTNGGDDGTDPHPPLELSFTVEPDRIPRLEKKLAEYEKRDAALDAAYQHPEYRVLKGDAQEMYKPLVLGTILEALRQDPQIVITTTAIAETLSSAIGLNVRLAAAPYVWSKDLNVYIPDEAIILDRYRKSGAEPNDVRAGIGFARAYSIISDYATGENRGILPGTGTGLPE